MDKLSEWVSPLEVVDGGSKGLHGITTGVRYNGANSSASSLRADSLDAGLVVWGPPDPFPSPIHTEPDMSAGASFMLWDNIWNTNYINWFPFVKDDANMLFRFRLTTT